MICWQCSDKDNDISLPSPLPAPKCIVFFQLLQIPVSKITSSVSLFGFRIKHNKPLINNIPIASAAHANQNISSALKTISLDLKPIFPVSD